MQPADDNDDFDDDSGDEQDLLLVLRLSNRLMGTHDERQQIDAFADDLANAIADANVGEYDGDELGGGECTLFFTTQDVDKLLTVLRPLLKRSPLCRGGHLVRMVPDADGALAPQRQPI